MKLEGLAVGLVVLAMKVLAGQSPEPFSISNSGNQPLLILSREPVPPVSGTRYILQVESSSDLRNWKAGGELVPANDGTLVFPFAVSSGSQFFRLRSQVAESVAEGGSETLFGFQRIYGEELRRIGFLPSEEFAARHRPSDQFLDRIRFDPTTAKFWDAFNAVPASVNQGLTASSPNWRSFDFRLNETELALFRTNGFVVSERLGSDRFADVFYRIFSDDLPVFISADSVLHAWHFSYAHMLSELEETHLMPVLGAMLDGMAAELAKTPDSIRQGPLRDSLKDADYFLAVARSLLAGLPVNPVLGPDPYVSETLAAISKFEPHVMPPGFPIFGTNRLTDFSQFKVRGYYDRSFQLSRYFQAFMWTARTDFRMLAAEPTPQSLRELGTACVLSMILQSSGQAQRAEELDSLLHLFVGPADSMTFSQFKPLLAAAGMTSLASILSTNQLAALHRALIQGELGVQLIQGDVFFSPFGSEQLQLPRSFALTGQRFVPDAWALTYVTYDRIRWFEEIPDRTVFKKVLRRVPSALDAAYAVLGNREIAWEFAQRMLTPGMPPYHFRDGFPYAHNLEALAATFDRIRLEAWRDSVYTRWLYALRALSERTTDARFPEAMRTRAWAMRTLNTQLASYTELKHDTVLYAKQPYAASFLCEYPAGFVEPVPEFWRRMSAMAEATAEGLERFPISGLILLDIPPGIARPSPFPVNLTLQHASRVNFCRSFAARMATLATMAEKELRQEPFTQAETDFIRGLMNRRDVPYSGPTFDGWYPGLFYKDFAQFGTADENGSNKPDPLVTDIFTAPPDAIDAQGGVLHEATGPVDFLLIAVDNGPDRMVYAGPVLSHYEFLVPGPDLTRMTDSGWSTRSPHPPRPDWTRSYLVPKNPLPP